MVVVSRERPCEVRKLAEMFRQAERRRAGRMRAQVELWYLGHRPRVDRERLLQAPGANEGVAEIIKVPNRGHSPTIDCGWREVAETGLAFVQKHGSMP